MAMTGQPAAVHGDVVLISVEALRAGAHLREGGLSQAHVSTLAELEGRWPPILVSTEHVVIDGHHRLAAAQRLGLSEVRARLFDGSPDDAYVEFVRCNVGHGLPLSLRDRKRAVGRILAGHPEWSDRRVARLCALSPTTVGRLRAEIDDAAAAQGGCPAAHSGQSDTRVGQDGRVRSLHPEGMRARVVEALSARPQSSLRAVAQAVGVSPETVRGVRKSLLIGPDNVQAPANPPPAKRSQGSRPSRHDGDEIAGSSVPDIAWLTDTLGRGRPATPKAPWQEDRALSSLDCGGGFIAWFEGTSVEEAECWRYLREVPLSRVYLVADEARRRATAWSTFAAALEDRVNKRAATS
jgi:hypothetical protein